MLKLLKEDFTYHRVTVLSIYCIGVFMVLGDLIGGIFTIDILMGSTTIAFFIGMLVMGITEDAEKRERLQVFLPISLKQFAAIRLLFMLLIQAGIMAVWFLHLLLKYSADSERIVMNILANGGYNLFFVTLFVLYQDLGGFNTKMWRILYLFGVLLLFSILIFLAIHHIIIFPISYGMTLQRTFFEGFIYALLSAGLLSLDYFIFLRRTTYLT